MPANIIGYVGIALITLGALVWIFRPDQPGEIEFEFLGFKAKVNAPALGVMAFGIAMTLSGYNRDSEKPPEPSPNTESKYAFCKIVKLSGSSRTSDQDLGAFELDIENNRIIHEKSSNGNIDLNDAKFGFACTGRKIFFYIDAAFNPTHAGPDPHRRTCIFEGDITDDHNSVSGTMACHQYAKPDGDIWSWRATITR